MPSYASFLRGINVGGQKPVPMVRLKAMCESAGFTDVATYVQSGNVVLSSTLKRPEAVEKTIRTAVAETFGFEVPVVVRTDDELRSVIEHLPFTAKQAPDASRLLVLFLDKPPAPALVKAMTPLAAKSPDRWKLVGREIYLYCPNGYGRTLLNNVFFERHLKVMATARNWKTVGAVAEMMRGKV